MHFYAPEKCVRIPVDSRLWITVLWGGALGLLVADTLDRDISLLSVWAFFLSVTALGWMCVALHAYSRRVVLEVMSWEHRNLVTAAADPAPQERRNGRPTAHAPSLIALD